MSKIEDIIIRSGLILVMVTCVVIMILSTFAAYGEMRERLIDRGLCVHEREIVVTRLVGKSSTTGVEIRCAEWEFPEGRP